MQFDESLCSVSNDVKECIKIISDRMINLRPRGELEYYPYYKNDVYYMDDSKGRMCVNLKGLYPEAEIGDVVYIKTNLQCVMSYEVLIHIWGNTELYIDGTKVYDSDSAEMNYEDNSGSVKVNVKRGNNELLFKAKCDEKSFFVSFMVSVHKWKWWARDYIFHSRATNPLEWFEGEDGVAISGLLKQNDIFDGQYVFPQKPVAKNIIDFSELYSENTGDIAYAVSYAKNDGYIEIKPFSALKVFLNNNEVDFNCTIGLKKGDCVLIKSLREDKWGFSYKAHDNIGIPFLKSNRNADDEFLLLGSFGTKELFDMKFGPEYNISFIEPYIDDNWNKIFWRLSGDNLYVRAYMDTCFFSQWFYALMVGHFGLLDASKALKDNNLKQYFCDSINTMASCYNYCKYEQELFGSANFLCNIRSVDFDNIGSMCVNFAELYRISPSAKTRYCMELLENEAIKKIPRFDDKTFRRPETMWADDTYMINPFLVRMGLIKKDDSYFDESVNQFLGYHKRLYIKEEGIYSHIYFPNKAMANNIPWGRGNGWIFNSLSDALLCIPDRIDGKSQLKDIFVNFAYALLKFQDDNGLWHQVLNDSDSYSETSCTAMFLLGLCRGVNMGLLNKKDFIHAIDKAYSGLIRYKIYNDGNVVDVCMGSSCSMEKKYYLQLGTIDNDDHGTGIILSAFAEYLKMQQ